MSPRAFVPDLDPLWDAVIMRCMERLPARRFQTAKEVADALTGVRPVEPSSDAAEATKSGKSGLWRSLFGRRKD